MWLILNAFWKVPSSYLRCLRNGKKRYVQKDKINRNRSYKVWTDLQHTWCTCIRIHVDRGLVWIQDNSLLHIDWRIKWLFRISSVGWSSSFLTVIPQFLWKHWEKWMCFLIYWMLYTCHGMEPYICDWHTHGTSRSL